LCVKTARHIGEIRSSPDSPKIPVSYRTERRYETPTVLNTDTK